MTSRWDRTLIKGSGCRCWRQPLLVLKVCCCFTCYVGSISSLYQALEESLLLGRNSHLWNNQPDNSFEYLIKIYFIETWYCYNFSHFKYAFPQERSGIKLKANAPFKKDAPWSPDAPTLTAGAGLLSWILHFSTCAAWRQRYGGVSFANSGASPAPATRSDNSAQRPTPQQMQLIEGPHSPSDVWGQLWI